MWGAASAGTKRLAASTAATMLVPCVAVTSRGASTAVDETELKAKLEELHEEHRDLDAAIDAIRTLPGHDQLQLARMKKRKLRLKDEIAMMQDQLLPDIIA